MVGKSYKSIVMQYVKLYDWLSTEDGILYEKACLEIWSVLNVELVYSFQSHCSPTLHLSIILLM